MPRRIQLQPKTPTPCFRPECGDTATVLTRKLGGGMLAACDAHDPDRTAQAAPSLQDREALLAGTLADALHHLERLGDAEAAITIRRARMMLGKEESHVA